MAIEKTPDEMLSNWKKRLSAAHDDFVKAVDMVKEAPGVAAARNKSNWVAAMTDVHTQDRWAKNVASVSLDTWKERMKNKGWSALQNAVTNVDESKMKAFYTWLIDAENAVLADVSKMPNLTFENRLARATTWIRGMHTKKYKK